MEVFFNKNESNNYNLSLIQKYQAKNQLIADPNNEVLLKKQKDADKELQRLNPSKNWNVFTVGNSERELQIGFEKLKLSLKNHFSDVYAVTIKEYYSLIEYLKESRVDG